ncbi:Redoxin [Dillenia turbinata]|uniref:glutaredoxin-dependent peroxiredoxin n=1 Tax=Dillenia turbinata TaxID=194707 RepID=A0AAN8W0Z3_9MAGN
MPTSVNNIAATFASIPIMSSSLAAQQPSPPLSSNHTSFTLSLPSPKSISTSWNPHVTGLHRSHNKTSSLLNLYGPPGPPPSSQSISSGHQTVNHRASTLVPVGEKLPSITLSYLDKTDKVQVVSINKLCKGKKVAIVGVNAAFSPGCGRFVKRIETEKSRGMDLIACVAVNDVFVVKAWGQNLAVSEKVMMLSDLNGEMCRAIGAFIEVGGANYLGLGVRSKRFCLSATNGVVTSVSVDD